MIDIVVICFYHLECSFYSITQLYITSWNSLKFRILLAVERGLVELRKLGIEQQLWEASRKEIDQSSAFSLSNHKSAKELDTLSWKIPRVYMDSNVSFLFFQQIFSTAFLLLPCFPIVDAHLFSILVPLWYSITSPSTESL